jgi:hypothetical protein
VKAHSALGDYFVIRAVGAMWVGIKYSQEDSLGDEHTLKCDEDDLR